jgi:ABC-type Fe3+/spermidine/putrescine transport system ATPase subunit
MATQREREPLLEVEHLMMRFGGLVAINDLSFSARRGDITAIIGPNGAGKTTVFNCITGFYKPSSGRILLSAEGSATPADIDTLTGADADPSQRPQAASSCSSACPISRSPGAPGSPGRFKTSACSRA